MAHTNQPGACLLEVSTAAAMRDDDVAVVVRGAPLT